MRDFRFTGDLFAVPEGTPLFAGVTDTPALRQIPGFEKILETARRKNPSRRLTQPEDVARTIAALCHPATYWFTGNVLHVDGGENIVG